MAARTFRGSQIRAARRTMEFPMAQITPSLRPPSVVDHANLMTVISRKTSQSPRERRKRERSFLEFPGFDSKKKADDSCEEDKDWSTKMGYPPSKKEGRRGLGKIDGGIVNTAEVASCVVEGHENHDKSPEEINALETTGF